MEYHDTIHDRIREIRYSARHKEDQPWRSSRSTVKTWTLTQDFPGFIQRERD